MLVCNANDYIGINGRVYPIASGELSNYGFTQNQFMAGGGICPLLNYNSQQLSSFILTSNGTIYSVSMAKRIPLLATRYI